MSGFASLLFQRIGSYTLLQRLVSSRLDVETVEMQRNQCIEVSRKRKFPLFA